MSYILDALKKAETERRATTLPEAAAVVGGPRHEPGAIRRKYGMPILIALLALVAGGLVVLAWQTRNPAQPPPLPATAAPETPQPVAPPQASPAPPAKVLSDRRPVLRHAHPSVAPRPRQQTPPSVPAKPSATANEAPLPTLHELPDAIRQKIPPLATSGYLYSGNPADRSVVLNGRLLREGDQVTPDLKLERLRPDGMVLNYQGHRFRTGY